MVYRVKDGVINTWYSSFLYNGSWQLDQTKGIERDLIQKLTHTERIRIDRESEASHDLIPSLDEPAGTDDTII